MADQVSLVAKMEVRLRDMEKQMAKAGQIADKGVRDIEKKFASANPKLPSGFLSGFAGGLAAIASTQTLQALRSAVGAVADMADQAERVGVSTKLLQEFQYAVQLSGGTAEEAGNGLEKFSKALSAAGTGSGDLAKVFAANNIAIRDAQGNLISTGDALQRYAELIKNAKTPQDQLNLATMAFGRGAGPALVLALKDGAQGFVDAANEATNLGAIIDDEVVAKARDLDDQFTQLEIVASSWAKSLAVTIADFAIPQLTSVYNLIRDIINILPGATASQGDLERQIGQMKDIVQQRGADSFLSKEALAEIPRLEKQLAIIKGDADPPLQVTVPVGTRPTVLPSSGGGGGGRRRGGGGSKRDRSGDTIKELELELEKTTAIGQAREDLITKEKILQEQRHAGVTAVSEEGKKIAELVTAIEKAAEEQKKIIEAMDQIRDVAGAGFNTFTNDLLEGKSAAEALNDSLKNMLSTILQIAQKNLLEGLFGKSGEAGGGILSTILGAILPGKASGGPVSAGKPYLIGEQGPELMVPTTSGTVIPNHALAGGGGGGNVQVNIINQNGSQVQQRTRQDNGKPVIDIVVAEMGKRLSNGDFDGPMKGRYGARPQKVR